MIASLRGRTTVFFSTHILADVERVCDTVAVLDAGRVVAHAPIDELTRRYAAHRVVIEVASGAKALAAALTDRDWVTDVQQEGERLKIRVRDDREAGRAIPQLVAASGLTLVRYEPGEVDLEDVFVKLVGRNGGSA